MESRLLYRFVPIRLLVLAVVGAFGCGESSHPSASKRGAISEETTVDTLAGSDDAVAVLVAPLPGTKEAPHWYRDTLRRLVDPNARSSFFSLRVYRIGGSDEIALADLELVLFDDRGEYVAEDIPAPAGPDRPEGSVLGTRSLVAIHSGRLKPAEGFEAWFAVAGSFELRAFQRAELRIGGRSLTLVPRSIATDNFSAFASQARRDWIVASVKPDSARDDAPVSTGR